MDFTFTPEQEAFRRQVREFCAREITPDLVARAEFGPSGRLESWEFLQKLARQGWLMPHWPRAYGGMGLTPMETGILAEETGYARMALGPGANSWVGHTLLAVGTPEQKERFLLPMAQGQLSFALGLTEPNAGSDAASVQMEAVLKGGGYLCNGTKIFQDSHRCDWILVSARTNAATPRHRGISLFLIDLKSPGVTVHPLATMSGARVDQTFFENVWVPVENLLGEKDLGWYQLMQDMDQERAGTVGEVAEMRRDFEELCEAYRRYWRSRSRSGEALALRHRLAGLAMGIEIAWCRAWYLVWCQTQGMPLTVAASMAHVHDAELAQRLWETGSEILGHYSLLWGPDAKEQFWPGDYVARRVLGTRVLSIWGGTTEVNRNIIAQRGLGLPR